MPKEFLWVEKKSPQLEMWKLWKDKSLCKGKHIVKVVVGQPLTKLVGRLRDKTSKSIYVHNN